MVPDRGPSSHLFRAMYRHGERIALDDGSSTWSYARLLHEIEAWVRILDAVQARRVVFRLPNGMAWIALDLALLVSGRLAVPLPGFFSTAQQRHVITASGADVLVTSGSAAGEEPVADFAPVLDHGGALVLRADVLPPHVHAGTAKLTFTSGTTGAPRGVSLSATNLLRTASTIETALGGEGISRHLCALPLSLLLENVAGVYASLGNGSRIAVPALADIGVTGSSGLDVGRFVEAQQRFRPESLILVPQLLLALTAARELGMALPASHRFVAVGGGRVAPSLLERAGRAGIPVHEGYGLTECGSVVAVNLPGACRAGSVGRPLPHAEVAIVDGEIHVTGNAMLGYLGEPPAPARVATGDLGRLDEAGYLYVDGRRKHGFITAFGRNVSPEWIESELTSEIAVAHAVVFGEALPGNVALIVPRFESGDQAVAAAVAEANIRLPDYARISAWRSVPAADFQAGGCLTDNGRVRRDAATSRYQGILTDLYTQLENESHAAIRSSGA